MSSVVDAARAGTAALPSGGHFAAGAGAIAATANGLAIDQTSAHGIINWQSFSIGAGETVQINNGGGATLNRVTGTDLSSIAGVLRGTGSVYLVNPNGVIVMPGGQVLTGGSFIATTRDIEFMPDGALQFLGSSAGTVVNQGAIVAANGDVVLVGRSVENAGSIGAPNGTVGLAAGDKVLLQPASGDQRLFIAAGTGNVTNRGTIAAAQAELAAADGNVYALAGNNGGIIRATGTAVRGGHVWLTAGDDVAVTGTVTAQNQNGSGGTITVAGGAAAGTVAVAGSLDASAVAANQAGGIVTLTGAGVDVGGTAVLTANGGGAGGTILIGGDRHGGADPALDLAPYAVADALQTNIAAGAQIGANGGGTGTGGAVVVWSDQQTSFAGAITARGGATGGNGGFVEVSSHAALDFAGVVDSSAPAGAAGTLLLDPADITISDAGTDTANANVSVSGSSPVTYAPTADGAAINATGGITVQGLEAELATNNVLVTTTCAAGNSCSGTQSGNITIAGAIAWSSANTLTLNAANNIAFGGSGDTIQATGGGSLALTAQGAITVGAALSATGGSGGITLTGASIALGAAITASGNVALTTDSISFAGAINAFGETVTIAPRSGTTAMNLGAPGGLSLTAAALGDISASTLVFGSATTTASMTVSGAVTMPDTITSLELVTGGSTTLAAGSALADANPGAAITLAANGLTPNNGIISAASGTVTIAPVTPTLSMNLGSGTNGLQLSNAMLGNITADAVVFGSTSELGAMTVTGTVTAPPSVTNLTLITGGVMTLNASGAAIADTNAGASVTLLTNSLNANSGTINAGPAGTVTIAPLGAATAMTLGSGGGGLQLSDATLGNITAGTLVFGSTGASGGMNVTGTVTAPATVGNLTLISDGAMVLSAGGAALSDTNPGASITILANSLAANAGTINAGAAGTVTIAPVTAGTAMTLGSGTGGLQLTNGALGNITAGSVVFGSAGATGGMSVTGTVTAPSTVGNLTLISDGATILSASGAALSDTNPGAAITLATNSLVANAGTISAGATGTVTIAPESAGTLMNLGGGTGGLQLSNATLGRITAGTLVFGSAAATGGLTVTGTVAAPSTVTNLALISDGATTLNSGSVLSDANSAASITLATNSIAFNTGTISAPAGTVTILPESPGTAMGLGTGAGALSLTQTAINDIAANMLVLGATSATGALQIGGAVSVPHVGTLELVSGGAIAIGTGASIIAASGGNITLATGTSFANAGGSGALAVSGGGRWLVYSQDPRNDSDGGLADGFVQYAASFPTAPVPASGNGFLYTLAPSATIGLTGLVSKVYDGTDVASLTGANYTITGSIPGLGDTIAVVGAPTGGIYAGVNVGTTIEVAVSGLTNAMIAATHGSASVYGYTLTGSSAFADIGVINPATLTVTPNAAQASYDGLALNNAGYSDTVGNYTISGFVNDETIALAGVTLTGSMAFNGATTTSVRNAGTYTLGPGTLALASANNNYVMSFSNPAPSTYVIDPLAVTVAGSRVYDGTVLGAAGILGVTNLVSGDALTLAGTVGLASRNAGTEEIASFAGLTLGGAAAGNYTLIGASGAVTISPAALTIAAAPNTKTYDGTTGAAATPTVTGLQGGDSVSGLAESYATPNAGAAITLAVNGGYTVNDGNDGGNYTVTTVTAAGVIDPLAVILAGSRVYDGTALGAAGILGVTNLVSGDALTLAGTVGLASRNVGAEAITSFGGLTLGGAAAGNYTLIGASGAVTISPAALTIAAAPNTKTYDGTTGAAATPTVTGLQGGDSVSGLAESYATPNAGAAITLAVNGGYTVNDGNDGGNYTVTTVTAAGVIDPLAVILAGSRVYDGTALGAAGILGVTNLVSGDALTLAGTVGLASRNVGAEAITSFGGLTLGGAAAGNYTLIGASGAVTISPAALTIAAAPNTKTYDGTTGAAATPTVTGLQGGDSVSGLAESYAAPNAGAAITLAVNGGYTVNDGNDGGNYTVTTVVATGVIDPLAVVVAGSRVYDGTTLGAAGILGVTNLVSGDALTLAGTVGLASRNVGAEAVTSFAGLTLGGAAAGNYTLIGASGAVTISPAALTIAAAPNTKTYDGTTGAAATPTVTGLQGGDSVSGLAESYAAPNAGAAITLAVNGGYTVNDGNDGGNYTVTTVTAAGVIDPLAVILAGSRVYDGTALGAAGILGVTNLVSGDALTLAGTVGLASRNVGAEAITSFGGLTLGGAAAGNYTLIGASGAVTISPAALTIAAAPNTKTYDGTTGAAATPTVTGLQGGDSVSGLAESYATPNAGAAITLAVNGGYTVNDGNDGGNYTVTTVTAAGVIDPLAVILAGSRVYDGTALGAAGILGVTNLVSGDALTLAGTVGLASRNVGAEAITSFGGLTLGGAAAGNYTLIGASGAVTISPAALTIAAAPNTKTYDGTTGAAATPTVTGLQGGDSVSGLAESYAAPNAGAAITLAVNGGYTVNDGNDGGNYTVTTVVATGVIDPLAVVVAGSRVYDGTTLGAAGILGVTNLVSGDALTLAGTVGLASRNVGAEAVTSFAGLTLGGAAAGNYTLIGASGAVTISPAALTIAAAPNTKTYDGTTGAAATPTVTGLQGGDSVSGLAESYAAPNAGAAITLAVNGGYTVNDGNDGGNYTVTTVVATGVIDPLAVVVAGSRVYDGTTLGAAGILGVTNLVSGDALTLAGTVGLASRNVGAEAVTSFAGLTLGGAAAGNYTLVGASGAVTISPAALTIAAAANTKTYDGTTGAAATPTVTGLQGGDSVSGLAESYATPNAGAAITLAVNGGYTVNDGNDGGNYTVTTIAAAGAIDPLAVTVAGSRVYDGTALGAAGILGVTNLVSGDALTLAGTVGLASRNVGAEAITSFAGLTLGGAAAGNYTLVGASGAVTISPASLTIAADDESKTLGQTLTLPGTAFTASGLIGGDAVAGVSLTSAGAAAAATAAGSPYAIVPSQAVGSGLGNYAIAYVDGTLTVNPVPGVIADETNGLVTMPGLTGPASTANFSQGMSMSAALLANQAALNGIVPLAGGDEDMSAPDSDTDGSDGSDDPASTDATGALFLDPALLILPPSLLNQSAPSP